MIHIILWWYKSHFFICSFLLACLIKNVNMWLLQISKQLRLHICTYSKQLLLNILLCYKSWHAVSWYTCMFYIKYLLFSCRIIDLVKLAQCCKTVCPVKLTIQKLNLESKQRNKLTSKFKYTKINIYHRIEKIFSGLFYDMLYI